MSADGKRAAVAEFLGTSGWARAREVSTALRMADGETFSTLRSMLRRGTVVRRRKGGAVTWALSGKELTGKGTNMEINVSVPGVRAKLTDASPMRTKFLVEKTGTGVRLVRLHLHESLKEKEGHVEVDLDEGDILDLGILPAVELAMLKEKTYQK